MQGGFYLLYLISTYYGLRRCSLYVCTHGVNSKLFQSDQVVLFSGDDSSLLAAWLAHICRSIINNLIYPIEPYFCSQN